MNRPASAWLFDVDGCLVDSHTGRSRRPLAEEVLVALCQAQRPVILWSAGGGSYARRIAERVGLGDFVDAYYDKAERDADRRWSIEHLAVGHRPAVCVDDRPEETPAGVTIIGVRPYIGPDPYDEGLRPVLEAVRALQS